MRPIQPLTLAVLLAATLACAGRKGAAPSVTEIPAADPASSAARAGASAGTDAAAADRAPAATDVGVKVVYFGFDEYLIPADAREELAQLAARWPAGASLHVAGHADERGTTQYNIALGERRAHAVKAYLVALGVPAAAIRTVSLGEEQPAVEGDDEAAWAKNRRAELELAQAR